MDNVGMWLAIWFGAAGSIIVYVLWPGRGTAGKSYGPDTAMGIGLSDVGRGDSGPGPGGAGGDGSSS